MGNPAILFSHGTQATTTSEADLFSPNIADKYYKLYINLTNMTGSETFVFKTYIWDEETGAYFEIQRDTLVGAPTPKCLRIGFEAATRFKVTVQKTAGTNQTITWLRADV